MASHRSMTSRVRVPLLLVGAALALAYWWPAFRVPDATGFGDWQMVHHNWEAGLIAVLNGGVLWPGVTAAEAEGITDVNADVAVTPGDVLRAGVVKIGLGGGFAATLKAGGVSSRLIATGRRTFRPTPTTTVDGPSASPFSSTRMPPTFK